MPTLLIAGEQDGVIPDKMTDLGNVEVEMSNARLFPTRDTYPCWITQFSSSKLPALFLYLRKVLTEDRLQRIYNLHRLMQYYNKCKDHLNLTFTGDDMVR